MPVTITVKKAVGGATVCVLEPIAESPPGDTDAARIQRAKLTVECHNMLDANGKTDPWYAIGDDGKTYATAVCARCGGTLPV